MTDTAAADHASVALIVNTLYRLFPSVDYRSVLEHLMTFLRVCG